MKPEEYELLKAACEATAASHPDLQRSQRESPNESAKSIENEISGFLGAIWQDRKSVYDSAEEALQPLCLLYDLALLQVCDLSHFGLKNRRHRSRVIWPEAQLPTRPSPNAVFYVLASNLAQSMQAFRLLVLHGFESQARATFRGVIETADLLTMVLAREATYREFIKSFEDPKDSYKHWRSHLSPSKIRAAVSQLEDGDPLSIPIDLTPNEIRDGMYQWLSEFVHVNFVAHIVAAHPADANGGSRPLAMLGNVGETSRATLVHCLLYLWITLLRIERLLWEQHRWKSLRGWRSRKWFKYRCRTLDELFLSYLPTYWEKNPLSDSWEGI
ncbi:hypothetical protein [Rhizobium sp. WW_1]|uniref:hypothetical protein n=1 Tax=Rhizobium sp. WW_1 TaxID=1907375 RepID=UPI000645B3AB|nr:hypothetical protein [Rhizobium sp. WW_1]RKD55741.1 hypothetical protein BJ928_112150 [Rhizobium sp. WW_1]